MSEDIHETEEVSSKDEDEQKDRAEVEFAKPMPLNTPKPDKFKKPILVGPRKGHKKNSVISSSNLNKILELNAKFSASKNIEVISDEPKEEETEPPQQVATVKEIPSSPLVISDFSDKCLPPDFPYTEPPWKGVPDKKYILEELKSGVIEKEIDLCNRSFTVLGRLEQCHITMAHPTVSRYHAVLQYRANRQGIYDKGFYLYDLGSTHGTFLNKNRVKPQTYIRIQVGHIIKFGCSTRMFILQGPGEDQEPESEFTVTELIEMRKQELAEREKKKEMEEKLAEAEELRQKEELESKGVDWGMSEDADEETDLSENPYAVTTNEDLYAEDPKKELKKWFEREGEELIFDTDQVERGKMVCRITLPLDNGKGGEVVIESTGKSKKEATVTCSLEACRYIDRLGLYRQSNQESKKRLARDWEENDYYDSDEDSYFDRTGDVDEKRQKRMRKAGKIKETVETYESLVENHKVLLKRIAEAEKKFAEMTRIALGGSKSSSDEDDELDQYMGSLKQNMPNKLDIRICQVELNNLKEEEIRLVNLINLARPTSLPELRPYVPTKTSKTPGSAQDSISTGQKRTNPSSSYPSEETDATNRHTSLPNVSDSNLNEGSHVKESIPNTDLKNYSSISKGVIGPHLPPDVAVNEIVKKPKRNRIRQRERSQKMLDSTQDGSSDYSDLTWQPPKGQTGDGRTSLNDKYGY